MAGPDDKKGQIGSLEEVLAAVDYERLLPDEYKAAIDEKVARVREQFEREKGWNTK